MYINFLKHGKSEIDISKFSAYVGFPEEESQFYLDAAVQHVQTATLVSLASNEIETRLIRTNSDVLPYGPIDEITSLFAIQCNGTKIPYHPNYCRLVQNKIYLPKNDEGWEIQYRTRSVQIGPSEELEVFRIGEKLLNGENLKPNEIRQNLGHLKSLITGGKIPV